jgi:hypothetical protein
MRLRGESDYEIKSVCVEMDPTMRLRGKLGYNPPPSHPRPFHKTSKVYTNPRTSPQRYAGDNIKRITGVG